MENTTITKYFKASFVNRHFCHAENLKFIDNYRVLISSLPHCEPGRVISYAWREDWLLTGHSLIVRTLLRCKPGSVVPRSIFCNAIRTVVR